MFVIIETCIVCFLVHVNMLEQSIEEVRKLIFVSFSEEEKLSIDDITDYGLLNQWMEPEEHNNC